MVESSRPLAAGFRYAPFRFGLTDARKNCSVSGARHWLLFPATTRRPIAQAGAGGFDGFAHAMDLVGGQIVHDDDVARSQGRCERLFDIGAESFSIHGAIKRHGRHHLDQQGCDSRIDDLAGNRLAGLAGAPHCGLLTNVGRDRLAVLPAVVHTHALAA
jgi:hypothetical protein